MTTGVHVAPVRKELSVRCPVDRAFRTFTRRVGRWWPLATHSVGLADAESVVFEERVGGRLLERTADGTEHVWGTVSVWEPGARIVFSWHPGRAEETAQEVEVRFEATGEGTRVLLEHRRWETLLDDPQGTRDGYDGGWDSVLGDGFAAAAAAPARFVFARHEPGPRWQDGVPYPEQPGVQDHIAFMASLDARGWLVLGGPLLDDSGGVAVLDLPVERARALAESDPAVTAGLLTVTVSEWMVPMGWALD